MHVTARENKKNEGKVVLKMSSDENNTNVEKTEEAPPVPEMIAQNYLAYVKFFQVLHFMNENVLKC